jgi:hypothetical protein
MRSARRVILQCIFVNIALCSPLTAHAERESTVFREAGVWLGAARTTYDGQFIEDSPAVRIPVVGFAAGAFARLRFGRWHGLRLGLQPEVMYSPRGADVELRGVYIGNFRASYLEIPILARVESRAFGPATLYVVAGPAASILLDAESGDMNGSSSDATETTSTLDMVLAAGVGATVAIGPRVGLSLETRYAHGFLTTDDSGEVEIENRALFLSLGLAGRRGAGAPSSLRP